MSKMGRKLADQEDLQKIVDRVNGASASPSTETISVDTYLDDANLLLDHIEGLTHALSLCHMDRIKLLDEVADLKDRVKDIPDFQDDEDLWDAVEKACTPLLGKNCLKVDHDLNRGYLFSSGEPVMILVAGDHPLAVHVHAAADQQTVCCVTANLTAVARPLAFGEYFNYDDHGGLLMGANAIAWASKGYGETLAHRWPGLEDMVNNSRLKVGEFSEIPSSRKKN